MTLIDAMLRHQIFLQRLTRSQANVILKYLKQAKDIVLNAMVNSKGKLDLSQIAILKIKLRKELLPLLDEALNKIVDLAVYETVYTSRIVKRYIAPRQVKKFVEPTKEQIRTQVNSVKISVALNRPPKTISNTYTQFINNKVNEFGLIVSDAQFTDDPEAVITKKTEELVKGLSTTQSLALAGVVILAASRVAKIEIAKENPGIVEGVRWDSVLESNTCSTCEDLNGEVFGEGEEVDYPAHSNCQCSLIPEIRSE